ncbi:MAG: succinate dehydrogenase cytochrome b subunit [Syntrophothermus sp.]
MRFSSIGKKIWMSLLGLFLMVFLIIHLGINLTLLRDDSGEWFRAASHFMGTNYIIKMMEIVLFAGFLLHIIFSFILQIRNWGARPVRYEVQPQTETPFMSNYMVYTGIIVLIFLGIHLMDFYFTKYGLVEGPKLPDGEADFYTIAAGLFTQPLYSSMYIILMIVLGFHLYHAFESAFQTLGLRHHKYYSTVRVLGILYSIIIPLGFIIIPVYYLI